MPILILGATGRTGSLILLEALRRGHKVTALVRTPSGLDRFTADLPDAQRANLTVVRGTPLSADDTNNAVSTALATTTTTSSTDASLVVISALSPRRTSENPWAALHPTDSPPRMMADSIANTITALRAVAPRGVQEKIIHISALGVGATGPNANWLVRAVIDHSNFRLAYEDHEAVDEELRAAGAGDGGDAGDGIR